MHLARVIGRVVATVRYPGIEGVPLQWIQPLDEHGGPSGDALVACAVVSTGPGDLVTWIDGREAALACPETFVPVDASILGFVEAAHADGVEIGGDDGGRGSSPGAQASPATSAAPAALPGPGGAARRGREKR